MDRKGCSGQSLTLNGKGINAVYTSYAGKVMYCLTVLYSLFPTAKSAALLSSHCRKSRVGSEILLRRAATDGLRESVPLTGTPVQSGWHCGAPNADLAENHGGSKEGT